MKNALILHGTDDSSSSNWFPWLKKQLQKEGWNVWVPDLPGADTPNIQRYNGFLLANKSFAYNEDTIIIGHSSGAVAALGLLDELPVGAKIHSAYLVGSFKDDLDWPALHELFIKPLDFEDIKKKAKEFVFIHSDNDPYCPLEHAQYLTEKINGKLIILKGEKHFSVGTNPKYHQFPELLKIIHNQ